MSNIILVQAKSYAAIALFCVACIGVYLPKFVSRKGGTKNSSDRSNWNSKMDALNMLSGGILLSAGFCHMLPDSTEMLGDVADDPSTNSTFRWLLETFPVSEIISSFTFLFLYILEEALLAGDGAEHLTVHYDAVAIDEHGSKDLHKHQYGSAMVLLVALTFHSFMEGMGLGSSDSKSAIGIFLAIFAHKALASMSLGSSLLYADVSSSAFNTSAIVMASGTPLGILIGCLASKSGEGWTAGICTAMASGTFINIATMEIIPSAMASPTKPLLRAFKLFLLLSGYLVFTALAGYV